MRTCKLCGHAIRWGTYHSGEAWLDFAPSEWACLGNDVAPYLHELHYTPDQVREELLHMEAQLCEM